MGAHELLRDDAHLLRQLDAARRPRLHDDRRGHRRAPPAAAGRGDLLPADDEHGSNIPRVAEEAGARAPGVRRSERRGLPGDDGSRQRVERFLRPHDRRPPQARVQEFLQRIYDRGDLRRRLRGPLLHALRVVLHEAELVEGLCPQHGIPPEFVEEKNYFFASPPTKSAFCGCTTTGRISCFRGFATTRPAASSSGGWTTSASAGPRSAGAWKCRGTPARWSTSGWTR